ncbi:MAG: hypothetical protein SCM11_00925 [Bacillota bacterium]|nr:hypothetical protein [Bacillota bacterium]
MRKLLFFDNQAVQTLTNMKRVMQKPVKYSDNPLFAADLPWEKGNLTLYGSVIKAKDRPFQIWYSIIDEKWHFYLSYAESDDGIHWQKPELGLFRIDGQKTNIVLDGDPHGPAILYDEKETREDWRYKMLCGAKPGNSIYAYHSADGINWVPVWRYPVITTGPDCPMGLLRLTDGRYVAYHRVFGTGRRVFRSESWDFIHWCNEPRLVFEPDTGDPPLTQFYGLGSAAYGNYELGTLWIYHVDPDDPSTMCGIQETELAYARSGYNWHRAMQGVPFLSQGSPDSWESGNIQMSSSPVFLDHEIRYYYAATEVRHARHWELLPQRAGLGLATIVPDRFIGLASTGGKTGGLVTMAFKNGLGSFYINAAAASGGQVRAAVLDDAGLPLTGMDLEHSCPISGDNGCVRLTWQSECGLMVTVPVGQQIRLQLELSSATLYAISQQVDGENDRYDRFTAW